MTSEEEQDKEIKTFHTLEEILRNIRAIRSDINKILDHLQEYNEKHNSYDTNSMTWEDLYDEDDGYQ